MFATLIALSAVLEVGPGKPFARIEDAVAQAAEGDEIHVFPDPAGYPKTAILVKKRLTIQGMGKSPVEIKGNGFEYSGVGSTPRAILQVEPSASGTVIVNLNLSGARNRSFNGAAIRIQAASNVVVRDCIIRNNDMGIMSNGRDGDPKAGSGQTIEYCLVEKNGSSAQPGFSHNLYLGGASAYLSHCEIRSSMAGHNVKSRTHFIKIDYCWIHDSVNREVDLVDSWHTGYTNSNAVLIGNTIAKDPDCPGNRGVLHFGQEEGTRVGNLYLYDNVFVSPFPSEVVLITSKKAVLDLDNDTFINTAQDKARLFDGPFGGPAIASGQVVPEGPTLNARNVKSSPGYGVISGQNNRSATSKSDLFGLIAPQFRPKDNSSSEPAPSYVWKDGTGNEAGEKLDREHRYDVGPYAYEKRKGT